MLICLSLAYRTWSATSWSLHSTILNIISSSYCRYLMCLMGLITLLSSSCNFLVLLYFIQWLNHFISRWHHQWLWLHLHESSRLDLLLHLLLILLIDYKRIFLLISTLNSFLFLFIEVYINFESQSKENSFNCIRCHFNSIFDIFRCKLYINLL